MAFAGKAARARWLTISHPIVHDGGSGLLGMALRRDWSTIHYEKSKQALDRDVVPHLGKLPIAAITPAVVTGVVKKVLKRGVRDTASKILQHVSSIFVHAQAHGLRNDNPAVPAQSILPKAKLATGRPALLTFPELGDLLRRAKAANLSRPVYMAHRLCAFAPGARIKNIVEAEWSEFELDGEVPTWIIPRAKMKAHDRHHDHKVILYSKIAEELREWRLVLFHHARWRWRRSAKFRKGAPTQTP